MVHVRSDLSVMARPRRNVRQLLPMFGSLLVEPCNNRPYRPGHVDRDAVSDDLVCVDPTTHVTVSQRQDRVNWLMLGTNSLPSRLWRTAISPVRHRAVCRIRRFVSATVALPGSKSLLSPSTHHRCSLRYLLGVVDFFCSVNSITLSSVCLRPVVAHLPITIEWAVEG
jgi:hypothetical protein